MIKRTCVLVVMLLVLGARSAGAHTDADVVAVPAGAPAEVTLQPTHGCGGSPTVAVSTRVPVAGATAGAVAGWTAATVVDDAGRTVIEWTGGSLPTDEVGAFPVRFTTPDEVGELLLFPFVQECADGSELAWISGDPEADNPAPRLLVLAAGSEPAATLDDVPAHAPGRDQLVQVVDVDNPQEPSPTTSTRSSAPSSTTRATTPDTEADGGGSDPPWPVILGAAGVVFGLALLAVRRARARAGAERRALRDG